MKRTKTKSIFGALCLFFGISLFSIYLNVCFNSNSVSAYSISITTSNSVSLDVSPSGTNTSIKEESINVQSNCRAGYNLNIATPNGSDLYLNGDGTTTASFTAVNGTSALSSSNNTNKWGYTLTSNPTSNTVFSPLSTNTSVLKTSAQTASPSSDINDTFSIYYGVKVDDTIIPGAYQMANNGAIVYYLTVDETCTRVNIAYDGNNADAGTMGAAGTGVIHTGVKDGDTITLIASNFSRTGYGFAGWSTDQNAGAKLIDNDNTNNPIVYGPQETVTLPNSFIDNDTDNDGIVKLYAVWIPSQGNLQGWMGCNNLDTATYDSTTGALDLTKNSVTALTDQRDNDTYAIARLADGQCWMIENLRLENTAAYNSDGALAQGYGTSATYGNFSGLANPESSWEYNSTVANSLYSTDGSNNTINIGNISNSKYRFPRYNNTNTFARTLNPTGNGATIYSYGNHYTWHAAIANLAAISTNNSSVVNTSLCPVGWHLPTGGSAYASNNTGGVNVTGTPSTYREFYNLGYKIMHELKTAYEDTINSGNSRYTSATINMAGDTATKAFRRYPNNFIYSGYSTDAIRDRGSGGYYWSSTTYSGDSAYLMYLNSSTVYPGTGSYHGKYISKSYGGSVRCIASNPINYVLSYNANGGSGAPASQTIVANSIATHVVSSSTPTRVGYTFLGWMDKNGNEVQASGTFKTRDANAVLYAVWANNSCNPSATTIGTGNSSTDAVCLQDVKPSMKANLPTADTSSGTYSLIDARDGQSYTVAKLVDGELWLTKNLNYGNSSDILLTSYDTDLPSGVTFMAPASTTSFETANNATTYVSPKILTDNTYGGYYSYASAIASTTAYSTASQNIATSICPKGWDLPTRTIYDNLLTTSGNTTYAKMNAAPYSFIYAGYRNGTSFSGQTNSIRLWTSTNSTAAYAYYTTAYGAASTNYKRYGESVRCVASNGTATINYNANGGAGTMTNQINADINSTTVSSNSFTAPTNRQFRDWNTKADGTGITVAANIPLTSVVSDGDTITLYAQWDEVYYIAFNANETSVGGTSGSATGTMTNQTVVRDASTAIKTNTFVMAGYIFVGWNSNADGTGAFYSDGQKVTNLTSTGNTITLYAIWVEGALLDTGGNVNEKLKRLAGNSTATYSTQDNTITAIARSNTLPDGFTPATENTISHSTSPYPIYAWYDSTNTTIYYYSEVANIMMNNNSSYFFQQMRALSDLSTISTWNTILVTNMTYMFSYTSRDAATFNLDLSNWNTVGVTNMSYMFSYAGSSVATFILNLSSWNTSNVTDMNAMFYFAGYSATTWSVGDLSSWDTSSVMDMKRLFSLAGQNATTWSVGDLSSWDTSNVINMENMFDRAGQNATTWSVGDLSSWDTSSVTDMSAMFYFTGQNATTWSVGDLSSWNTSNVKNMKDMFRSAGYSAASFSLDLSSWDTSNVINMENMFDSAGQNATTWSVTIPKTNNGTATGPITNTTSRFYGNATSVYGSPPSGRSFTLAN